MKIIKKCDWKEHGIKAYKEFPIAISEYSLHVIVCEDIKKLCSSERFRYSFDGDDLSGKLADTCIGFCIGKEFRKPIVVVIKDTDIELNTVVHEAFHAAMRFFDFSYLKRTVETEEIFAMAIAEITMNILKTVGKRLVGLS